MTERNWTIAQNAAIEEKGTNLLVSAGAGSGKTAVLIERIIRKITDLENRLNINELLVVTFTNAAAEEMRQRLGKAINRLIEKEPDNKHLLLQSALLDQAHITTLHSFCLDLIRKNFYHLDLDPSFRVAAELERQLLYHDTLESFLEEQYAKENPLLPYLADCYGGNKDDRGLNALIWEIYDFSQSQPYPEKWLEESINVFSYNSLDQYPWSSFWQEEIIKNLICVRQMLINAIDSGYFSDIPQAWQECFLNEADEIKSIISQDKGLTSLVDRLYYFQFERLPSAKKDSGIKEAKEYCRKYRDYAKKIFNKAKKQFFPRPSFQLLSDLQGLRELMAGLKNLVSGYTLALDQAKRRRSLIDYNDMEHLCLILLEDEKNGVREQLRKEFKEILVDEYQDINGIQNRILEMIASQDNFFMVGDIKQSIYGFRLAEPELFIEKFCNYEKGLGGKKIDLTENFRSTEAIIEGVNFIFCQLMGKELCGIDYDESARLRSGKGEEGAAPEVYLFNYLTKKDQEEMFSQTEQENDYALEEDSNNESDERPSNIEENGKLRQEARFIASKILELKGDGYDFCDMAVLLRSPKNKEDIFIEELTASGIPVLGSGQGVSPTFAEVELLISLLEVIDNPLQDIPLAAVLHSPLVNIDLDRLLSLRCDLSSSLYEALENFINEEEEDNDDREKASAFLNNLKTWRHMSKKVSVSELLNIIFHDTGLFYLAGSLPGGSYRHNNLLDFYELAKEYDTTSFKGLFRFLCFIKDIKEKGQQLIAGSILSENENVVRIMSIHRSKGLEFAVVFLAGLGDSFNLRSKNSDMVFDQDLFWGPKVALREELIKYPTLSYQVINYKKRKKSLAEEMRILYVAMTRAKDRLILSASVRKLDEAIKKWSITADTMECKLPESVIAEDMRYIDWLGRALIRHPAANKLQEISEENNVMLLESECKWRIDIIDHSKTSKNNMLPKGDLDLISRRKEENKAYGDVSEEIKAILDYSYPYSGSCNFPAKWTVTELQKSIHENAEDNFIFAKEKLREEIIADPFLRGSLLHLILEKLDLSNVAREEEIEKQIYAFLEKGYFSEDDAALIDIRAFSRFFDSSIGKRVQQATIVERELAFTYALPAYELVQDAEVNDRIIIQGMVDMAFFEEDGWVVIDYKTGNINSTTEELKKKYAKQVRYYCRALSDIFKQPVKEAYLYMLDDGRSISLF